MPQSPRSIILDATGHQLGRLASDVAKFLRGKHRADFTPNKLPLVHVTVKNLRRIGLTPKKLARPVRHFSGYPGGLRTETFAQAFQRNPERAFRRVVQRMLPDNKLRQRLLRFLHTIE